MRQVLSLTSALFLTAAASHVQAGSIESLLSGAEARFLAVEQLRSSPDAQTPAPAIPEAGPVEPDAGLVILKPTFFKPVFGALGAPAASFSLAERLDAHRGLLPLQLGASVWNVSVAADAGLETGYFAFQRGDEVLLERMNFDELRRAGSVYALDGATAYRFKVEVSLLDPVHRSELRITPGPGTQGPRHTIKTGKILEALHRNSVAFKVGGVEYLVLYGTDVDPATNAFARTRSLVFMRLAGLGSKAWPVPESSLQTDQPVGVSLGKARIALSKGSDGMLRIYPQ